MPKLAYRYDTRDAIACKTRVLLIASATARFTASRYSGFRSPTRPPGSFNGPEGGKSLFSFNRTSGYCWRCKPVCRVKASIPGASGQRRQRHCRTAFADTHASSTASRNSLHRSRGLANALRSGIRLVESFLTGLSCSQQNFPQSIAGRLPIWRHSSEPVAAS
jgi:hypothetical protein